MTSLPPPYPLAWPDGQNRTRNRERSQFRTKLDGERATLEVALAALDRRRGGVIGICGEAGLGKSRLVHSVVRESDRDSPHKTIFAAATALAGPASGLSQIESGRHALGAAGNRLPTCRSMLMIRVTEARAV